MLSGLSSIKTFIGRCSSVKVSAPASTQPRPQKSASFSKEQSCLFTKCSRFFLNILEKINFRKLILISSTRVYGREQIGLLDESTEPQPSDFRGKLVYDYENLFIKKYNKETFVLRFAGLYTNKSEVTFLNNLHRDSAAEIIYFILSNQNFETKSYIINCVNSVNAVPGERLISNKKLIDLGFKFRDI